MNYKRPLKNTWDKEWDKYNNNPYFKPNIKLINIILKIFNNNLKNKKILELGAGSGSDIVYLTKKGAAGYAADFSQKSIESINYWAEKKKVKIHAIQADIKKLPFKKNSFDLVYSVGLMEHFNNIIPLLKKQLNIIKPGGFLIIDVPQKYTLYTIAKHIRMNLGAHPFGWETEFSKKDLIKIAKNLNQEIYLIYGREFDIFDKLSLYIKNQYLKKNILPKIEKSWLAPHLCLCAGLVIKKK